MKWFKIHINDKDLASQKEFYYNFLDVFTRNKRPEFLKLYQAEMVSLIEYYISCNDDCETYISDFLLQYKANISPEPDPHVLSMIIGRQ